MYQSQNYYYQNLGVAGHRPSSYLQNYSHQRPANPFYQTYQQQPHPQQHQQQPQYQPQHIESQPYQANFSQEQQPNPAQNQPVNGGINSVLQYDLNNMSTFLSWCSFGMLKQSRNPTSEFEGFVVSVLFATRLPKSTIIIALEYMNQRFSSNSEITAKHLTEHEIFIYLIVALILANKFNDDNTFTNKSWCGATGLQLELLNKCEMKWLEECKWSLNVVNFESNILTLEQCWKTWLEKYDKTNGASDALEGPGTPVGTTSPLLYSSPSSVHNAFSYPTSSPPTQSYYPPHLTSHFPVNSIPSSPVSGRILPSVSAPTENGYYYPTSSPLVSSPITYDNSNVWGEAHTNIWNYAAPATYHHGAQPHIAHSFNNDPAVQYVGSTIPHEKQYRTQPYPHRAAQLVGPSVGTASQYPTPSILQPSYANTPNGYVGYSNPYYNYNMAMC